MPHGESLFELAHTAQAQRNVAARRAMIDEFGAWTEREFAESGGAPDVGIFSVRFQGSELYPRFQFNDEGRPLNVIAEVLALLHHVRKPWEIALWFTAANGWLGGVRPVDLLRAAPERVVEAARHEAEQRVF